MANTLGNRVKMSVSGTPGTGVVTLGTAIAGFQSFSSAGIASGSNVPYVIEDATISPFPAYEIGVGAYSSTSGTGSTPGLTRTNVTASSNSSSAISATSNAVVYVSPLAADLKPSVDAAGLSAGFIPYATGGSLAGSSNLYWDSTNTRLGVGTTSPTAALHVVGVAAQFSSTSSFSPQLTCTNQAADTSGPYFIVRKNRSTSSGTVSVGDALGTFLFSGSDTNNANQNSAYISCSVAAVGAGNVDGNLQFYSYGTSGIISLSCANTITLNSTAANIGVDGSTFINFNTASTERMRVDNSGNLLVGTTTANATRLTVSGPAAFQSPSTQTGNYSLTVTDHSLIFNGAGTITLTLLAASSYPGRMLYVKTIAAQAVNSASSNVAPISSATAGTAILAATAGKWAILQSDGTNWIIMASN